MITITVNPVFIDRTISIRPNLANDVISVVPKIGSVIYAEHEKFNGDYEYTPSAQTQTIPIGDLIARQDIIINPIPNNYGLITWDGSTLTVS